jgi:uncharacterized protein DUF4038/uncharacterized protein DUF5060
MPAAPKFSANEEEAMRSITRRSFLEKAGISSIGLGAVSAGNESKGAAREEAASTVRYATVRRPTEWAYNSAKAYADPFNEVELDVLFSDSKGREQRVPAFWAAEQTWRVRYAAPAPGRYTYRTVSNDPANPALHGQTGVLEVSAYEGENSLHRHGPVRVASDGRHFEHEDGTPFFWLGDTWWMGLCRRLRWPDDFQALVADRLEKGFTVVQIIAGLYPDMPPFDPRGANEAGFPWEADYARVNPHYFDMADLRIQYLVDRGLVPCVVGCWGYFLPFMGVPKMKKHWRYLVARWGAYPVIWCLAGEGTMPYYLSTTKAEDATLQKRGWTELGKYLRSVDPYHHPITIHPTNNARDQVEDPSILDFDMLQTGHSGRKSIPSTVNQVVESLTRTPRMPVLVGEVCYEGILGGSWQDIQRFMFWSSILNGAGGHTYGANGIWQVNTAEHPYGPSPHGGCWGNTPWETAYQLLGSGDLGLGKKLLARYAWWRLEPHPEWVDPHWSEENYELPYAAGIPGEFRVIYIPLMFDRPRVQHIEPGVDYRAFYFDPAVGKQYDFGRVEPDGTGSWQAPITPTFADWVLVMEKIT